MQLKLTSVSKTILHVAGVPILVVHGQAMPTTETVGSLSDFRIDVMGEVERFNTISHLLGAIAACADLV